MKRSFNTTLILVVICAGLIAWYAIYEKKIKKSNNDAEEKAKQLVTLDKDQIQELTIKWNKNPPDKEGVTEKNVLLSPEWITIKLQKSGQDWNIVEPIRGAADNSVVSAMLSTLTTSKQERVVDDKAKDLEPYSLKTPIVSVIAKKDATSVPQEVDFGRGTPVGYSVYAKNNPGESVFRVAKSMRTAFEKDLKTVRNKNIFNIPRNEITEIEIHHPKEDITLKKADKDIWILASENLPADTMSVNSAIGAAVDLKVVEFVSEDAKDLKPYGLNNPLVRVSLKRKDNSHVGLLLSKSKENKVYAKREDKPNVYEVDKGALENLTKASASYRNKEIASFNRFEVKRIKFERGKDVLELLKQDTGWTIATEPGKKIDGTKVDGLLTKIQDTKITDYLPASDLNSKFKDPQLVLRLFEKKDKAASEIETVNLKFARENDKYVPVERSGLSLPFKIKEEDYKKLLLTKDDLQTKPEQEAKKEVDKKRKS